VELREVIGRRRSIRFLNPDKPVEKEKIQIMFEAARIASHWGNTQSLRAVALFKDEDKDLIDILQGAVIGWQFRIAPVVIVWFVDPEAAVDYQAESLMKLADVGALGVGTKEVRRKGVEEKLLPFFASIGEVLKAPGVNEMDCGQGIAQATLAAFELGLGTCCLGPGPRGQELMRALGIPDHCRMLVTQTVGYPLEHWEAGGQRPRLPFQDLFHIHRYGQAYPREEAVVEELRRDGMFTAPAPLPGRDGEILMLKQALGLKEPGVL
jgi:nitroreductase